MEQLFSAVSDILKGLGPNSATDEALAFVAWGRCAGALLRARTKAVEFFENRLVIAVEDETWRRHLEDLSPQMLVRLNGILGDRHITFIEFRVDPSAVKERMKKKAESAKTAGEIEPSLASAAEAISDNALRERFLNAAATCLHSAKA